MSSEQNLRDLLEEAQQTILIYEEKLARLEDAPLLFATVVSATNSFDLDAFEIDRPVVIIDREIIRERAGKRNQFLWGKILAKPAKDGRLLIGYPDGQTETLNIGLDGNVPQVKLIGNDGNKVVLSLRGDLLEVNGLPGVPVYPADSVKVDTETRQIHAKLPSHGVGQIVSVKAFVNAPSKLATEAETDDESEKAEKKGKKHAKPAKKAAAAQALESTAETDALASQYRYLEIEGSSGNRIVIYSLAEDPDDPLKIGDRVMLDSSETVVIAKLPADGNDRFNLTENVSTTWDDIAGLEEAKESLQEAIETPFLHPEVYAHYNKKPPKGVLVYGPPGCGKTLIAKAAANSLARVHKVDQMQSGFIYVKGPELLSKWVGQAEAEIRSLFARGKEHYRRHGYPALLFIDEVEALLPVRGSGKSSDIENTIVPQFLSEMDGLEASGVMVLLATNQPGRLDPAVIREGRVDRHVKVARPSESNAPAYFKIHLRETRLADRVDAEEAIGVAVEEIFSEKRVLFDIAPRGASAKDAVPFRFRNSITGSMIAAICEKASSRAMKRDIKNRTLTGVTIEDLVHAIDNSHERASEHPSQFDVEEFCNDVGIQPENLQVIRRAS